MILLIRKIFTFDPLIDTLMKRILFLFVISAILLQSCVTDCNCEKDPKPKLVIGMVVDQMRYDYLTRFKDRYGEDGFKRLLKDGYTLKNAHFSYIPTYTAVGHSSAYTGTTPDHHGIIGNNWYDKYEKKWIYCVEDSTYTSVGVDGMSGQKSPYRLATTTITDQLRMAQNMKGKTIGLAIKDRSSILPSGHTGNGAFWYEGKNDNKWITSSYYMDELPEWVKNFNDNNKADEYLSKPWNTLQPIETYTRSREDNYPYEGKFWGEIAPVFPHNIPELREKNRNFEIIKSTPFGNTLTFDFAKAAVLGENLGKGDYIDFLAVSFSSTDYVGHQYGPNSVEIEDTYLRFDQDLADFLKFLDKEVGENNYTLFMTADHGVAQIPAYLKSLKIPADYFDYNKFNNFLKKLAKDKFGSEKIIESFSNYQIFLNKEELKKRKLDEDVVTDYFVQQCVLQDGIYKAVSAKTLQSTEFTKGVLEKLQNGYNQKFSGDVLLIPTPASIGNRSTGTTHGSGYSYDTHIPIIFFGNGIKSGSSSEYYRIKDIAPTLSILLDTEFPSGTTGKVVTEALK